MKHLIVAAAGLGWKEAKKIPAPPGLEFKPAESVFPAVTCTVQAAFRTASGTGRHGMICNGIFSRSLHRALFWEQSCDLVEGERIWERARADGKRIAMFFWQQSLGEKCDILLSPAPIHKHGGGIISGCHSIPSNLDAALAKKNGAFPLHRYWGPLASPSIGNDIVAHTIEAVEKTDPDIVFTYLPTLDYDLQRFGPDDPRCARSFGLAGQQLAKLAAFAEKHGAHLTVFGDYAIAPAGAGAVYPNRTLRAHDMLSIRTLKGRAYADLHHSRAFAMTDHEIAHVFVRDSRDITTVHDILSASGDYGSVEIKTGASPWGHANAGEILLTAKNGAWCHYPWWTASSEAPDYATHVDIHSKPGFDPCELFFGSILPPRTCQDASRIGGTHGRNRPVAWASTAFDTADSIVEIARQTAHRL